MIKGTKNVWICFLLVAFLVGSGVPFSFANDSPITFEKTYNKDGKFFMPVVFNGYNGSDAKVIATLVNEFGEAVETFKEINANPGMRILYSKAFAKLSPGTYYLNVRCEFLFNDPLEYALKISHKTNGTKMTFIKTYQTYTNEGDAKQVFKFEYSNALNKKLNYQIYDQYGTLLFQGKAVALYKNGSFVFNWDYYPSSGGLKVASDIYIIKYWAEGQTPKQLNFEVNLGEG